MTAVCPAGHTSSSDDYCDVCGMPIAEGAGAAATAPPPPPEAPEHAPTTVGPDAQSCPSCGTANSAEALFCESCGYDFTTGAMPRSDPAGTGALGSATPDDATAPDAESTLLTSALAAAGRTAGGSEAAAPGSSAGGSPGPSAGSGSGGPFEWVAELWIDPAWYEAQDSPDPLPSPGLPQVLPLRSRSVLVGRTSRSRNIHPDIDCGADSGVSRRQAQLTTDGTRWFVEDLDSANGTFVGPASGSLPETPIAVGVKQELDADDRVYIGAWTRLVIRQATEEEKAQLS